MNECCSEEVMDDWQGQEDKRCAKGGMRGLSVRIGTQSRVTINPDEREILIILPAKERRVFVGRAPRIGVYLPVPRWIGVGR